jgi:hypothetical protein
MYKEISRNMNATNILSLMEQIIFEYKPVKDIISR